jgi:hypothetical protein
MSRGLLSCSDDDRFEIISSSSGEDWVLQDGTIDSLQTSMLSIDSKESSYLFS